MLYKVTYFGNAVNYGSEQFFMCPMFVTECFHNKCLNCQPCVQFIFSPGCESNMILSVMTQHLKHTFADDFFGQPQLFLTLDVAVPNTINTCEFHPSIIPGSKFIIPSQ